MLNRILLAIDDDAASWAAARFTARLVGPLKAHVTVIHVHSARHGNVLENDPEYRVAQRLVDDVGLELSRTGAWSRSEVRVAQQDQIAVEILAAAHELNAELVIIGSRGRLGATGFLTGSVGRDVLVGAGVPVLVVRESAELPEGTPRKLLLAIDGVHSARRLTDLTIDLARAFGAEVLVAHVGFGRAAGLEGESGLPDADLSGGEEASAEAVAHLSAAGVKVTRLPIENIWGTAVELAKAADESSADLIIVGARRPATLGDKTFGHIYADVVAHSRRPVLVDSDPDRPD
jgi:nucleotide-binding universal stress UspA family protein